MLSAVIPADAGLLRMSEADGMRAIVKTLAALVPLVVADVIADAAIVALPEISVAGLEDSAGCRIFTHADLATALDKAMSAARRDHIVILHPGFAPDAAFIGELEQVIERDASTPMAMFGPPETFVQRLFASGGPVVGIIAQRSLLKAKATGSDISLPTLRRALSAVPMRSRAVRL